MSVNPIYGSSTKRNPTADEPLDHFEESEESPSSRINSQADPSGMRGSASEDINRHSAQHRVSETGAEPVLLAKIHDELNKSAQQQQKESEQDIIVSELFSTGMESIARAQEGSFRARQERTNANENIWHTSIDASETKTANAQSASVKQTENRKLMQHTLDQQAFVQHQHGEVALRDPLNQDTPKPIKNYSDEGIRPQLISQNRHVSDPNVKKTFDLLKKMMLELKDLDPQLYQQAEIDEELSGLLKALKSRLGQNNPNLKFKHFFETMDQQSKLVLQAPGVSEQRHKLIDDFFIQLQNLSVILARADIITVETAQQFESQTNIIIHALQTAKNDLHNAMQNMHSDIDLLMEKQPKLEELILAHLDNKMTVAPIISALKTGKLNNKLVTNRTPLEETLHHMPDMNHYTEVLAQHDGVIEHFMRDIEKIEDDIRNCGVSGGYSSQLSDLEAQISQLESLHSRKTYWIPVVQDMGHYIGEARLDMYTQHFYRFRDQCDHIVDEDVIRHRFYQTVQPSVIKLAHEKRSNAVRAREEAQHEVRQIWQEISGLKSEYRRTEIAEKQYRRQCEIEKKQLNNDLIRSKRDFEREKSNFINHNLHPFSQLADKLDRIKKLSLDLILRGADPGPVKTWQPTLLSSKYLSGRFQQTIEAINSTLLMIQQNIEIPAAYRLVDENNFSMLNAIWQEQPDAIDVIWPRSTGMNLLHHARSPEVADFLLEKGLVPSRDSENGTLFHRCVEQNWPEMLVYYLKKNVDDALPTKLNPFDHNDHGKSPLHLSGSINSELLACFKPYLDSNEINKKDNAGNTPLDNAVFSKDWSLVNDLIVLNANSVQQNAGDVLLAAHIDQPIAELVSILRGSDAATLTFSPDLVTRTLLKEMTRIDNRLFDESPDYVAVRNLKASLSSAQIALLEEFQPAWSVLTLPDDQAIDIEPKQFLDLDEAKWALLTSTLQEIIKTVMQVNNKASSSAIRWLIKQSLEMSLKIDLIKILADKSSHIVAQLFNKETLSDDDRACIINNYEIFKSIFLGVDGNQAHCSVQECEQWFKNRGTVEQFSEVVLKLVGSGVQMTGVPIHKLLKHWSHSQKQIPAPVKFLRAMLLKNSPPDKSDDRKPLLYQATENNHLSLMQVLIEKKVDLACSLPHDHNDHQRRGWTPLHRAAETNNIKAAKLIFNANKKLAKKKVPGGGAAKIFLPSRWGGWQGYTPIDIAKNKRHIDMIKLLENNG